MNSFVRRFCLTAFFAFSITTNGQEAQTFDAIPEDAQVAFVELYGGHYSAYAAYIGGPQPFVLPDGEPYIPLTFVIYLLQDNIGISNNSPRDRSFLSPDNMNIRITESNAGSEELTVGQAHYDIEAYWLESDVYLPATTFLSSLGINTIWDPITRILTVPEAQPLETTRYQYAQDFSLSIDSYPVRGEYTNVLLPSDVNLSTDENGYEFLNVSVNSFIDIPVGINILDESGGQLGEGHAFESCLSDACSVEYFITSFKSRSDSRIILFEILTLGGE